VAGAAVLLGSAIEGPGFDSRGSRDAAIDMFRCTSITVLMIIKKLKKI
jgi:hypothetical protein